MFSKIEKLLLDSRHYNWLRYNYFSNLLVEMKTNKTLNNIAFYSSFLDATSDNTLVFDIGSNKGNKVKAFLDMGFKVVALEPEQKSIETLKWRFAGNPKVTIVEKGVSHQAGQLPVYITESRSGLNTLSEKWVKTIENETENRWHSAREYKKCYTIQTTTLDALIKSYGVPYFIKIDVEGFELNVVKGLSKAPKFLSFECNLPEFLSETIEIIHLLEKLAKRTQFQFSTNDALGAKEWLDCNEILNIIQSGKHRYLEIICEFD